MAEAKEEYIKFKERRSESIRTKVTKPPPYVKLRVRWRLYWRFFCINNYLCTTNDRPTNQLVKFRFKMLMPTKDIISASVTRRALSPARRTPTV